MKDFIQATAAIREKEIIQRIENLTLDNCLTEIDRIFNDIKEYQKQAVAGKFRESDDFAGNANTALRDRTGHFLSELEKIYKLYEDNFTLYGQVNNERIAARIAAKLSYGRTMNRLDEAQDDVFGRFERARLQMGQFEKFVEKILANNYLIVPARDILRDAFRDESKKFLNKAEIEVPKLEPSIHDNLNMRADMMQDRKLNPLEKIKYGNKLRALRAEYDNLAAMAKILDNWNIKYDLTDRLSRDRFNYIYKDAVKDIKRLSLDKFAPAFDRNRDYGAAKTPNVKKLNKTWATRPVMMSFTVSPITGIYMNFLREKDDRYDNKKYTEKIGEYIAAALNNAGFPATPDLSDTSKIRLKESERYYNRALRNFVEYDDPATFVLDTPFIDPSKQDEFQKLFDALGNAGINIRLGAMTPMQQDMVLPTNSGDFEYLLAKRERHNLIREILRTLPDDEKFDIKLLKYMDFNGNYRKNTGDAFWDESIRKLWHAYKELSEDEHAIIDKYNRMSRRYTNYHQMKLSSDLRLCQMAEEHGLDAEKIVGRKLDMPDFDKLFGMLEPASGKIAGNTPKEIKHLYRGTTHSDPYAHVAHIGNRLGLALATSDAEIGMSYACEFGGAGDSRSNNGLTFKFREKYVGFMTEYNYAGNIMLKDQQVERGNNESVMAGVASNDETLLNPEKNKVENIYLSLGNKFFRVPLENGAVRTEYEKFARWTKPTICENPILDPLYREALGNGGKVRTHNLAAGRTNYRDRARDS